MRRLDTKPRSWHVRRGKRRRPISYGVVIGFVVACEVSVLCVLGKRPMPFWVLQAMILAPIVVAVLVWAWSSVTSSQGDER